MTESLLSEREQELLKLVATGASNKEISQELFISINTVKVHLRNIYTKLEVASRTEAAMWAVQNGLVDAGKGGENIDLEETGSDQRTLKLISWFNRQSLFQRIGLILSVSIIFVVILGFSISYLLRSEPEPLTPEMVALVSNLEEERWKQLTEMPTARAGLAATAYNNMIYAVAGEGENGVVGVNEVYNPLSGNWETLAPKPVPVSNVQAGVIGGLIYIPGGQVDTGEVTDILEVYNPRTDTWSNGATLLVPISAYALATLEGNLYVFGGWDGSHYVNTVYEYDPSQDLWTELSAMPTARGYGGAAAAGSKIFVIGGFDGEKSLSINEVYVPELDNGIDQAWSNGVPMPLENYGMGVSNASDYLFVIGGSNDINREIHTLNYSNPNLVWSSFESPINFSWSRMAVVNIGSQIYILGGEIDGLITKQNVSYTAVFAVALPFVGK